MSTLGEKIKYLRNEKDQTQEDFARMLNVYRSTLANWETDRALPDLNTIKQIANYFEVSIDYLLDNNIPKKYDNSLHSKIDKLPEDKKKLLETITDSFLREEEPNDEQTATAE